MRNLNRTEIKFRADKWALIQRQLQKAERAEAEEMKEFQAQYDEATKEIREAHEPRISVLREKAAVLEKEIFEGLKAINKPITLNGDHAIAANIQKIGNRVVDPKKFFEIAKERFWACITVGVAKAEEAIGKTELDKIATKPTRLEASLSLK